MGCAAIVYKWVRAPKNQMTVSKIALSYMFFFLASSNLNGTCCNNCDEGPKTWESCRLQQANYGVLINAWALLGALQVRTGY